MADNIVSGLFGVSPEMLTQSRAAQDYARNLQAVQLTPMQQGNLMLRQGASELGNVGMSLLGVQDPEMQKVTAIKQLSSQFDLTSPTGMREFARSLQQIAPQEAMMAAKRADEMDLGAQQIATQRSQEVRNLREPTRTAFSQLVASGKYTPASIALYEKSQNPADLVLVEKKAKGDGSGDGSEGSLGKLTTAQKSIDTKFGKEYADFFAGGGINNLEKNVSELARAIKIIKDAPEGATSGKLIGLADKTGQLTLASQLAADVKDIIGGVAQSNLRQVLGGQFAAKEGEALLQRAYDTGQTKDNNLKRLNSLYEQASDTIRDKKAAAQYYEQFGTLKGFKGTKPKEDEPPPKDKNQEALDWIKANPTDPRVPAIKKKLGIQ